MKSKRGNHNSKKIIVREMEATIIIIKIKEILIREKIILQLQNNLMVQKKTVLSIVIGKN
jgi:hypothetical protein